MALSKSNRLINISFFTNQSHVRVVNTFLCICSWLIVSEFSFPQIILQIRENTYDYIIFCHSTITKATTNNLTTTTATTTTSTIVITSQSCFSILFTLVKTKYLSISHHNTLSVYRLLAASVHGDVIQHNIVYMY